MLRWLWPDRDGDLRAAPSAGRRAAASASPGCVVVLGAGMVPAGKGLSGTPKPSQRAARNKELPMVSSFLNILS